MPEEVPSLLNIPRLSLRKRYYRHRPSERFRRCSTCSISEQYRLQFHRSSTTPIRMDRNRLCCLEKDGVANYCRVWCNGGAGVERITTSCGSCGCNVLDHNRAIDSSVTDPQFMTVLPSSLEKKSLSPAGVSLQVQSGHAIFLSITVPLAVPSLLYNAISAVCPVELPWK